MQLYKIAEIRFIIANVYAKYRTQKGQRMLFPIIKIRDKATGNTRIVGTNIHDVLYIEDGAIHYLNTQCMCGTRFDDAAYEFVGIEYEDPDLSITGCPEVKLLPMDDVMDLAIAHLVETSNARIRAYHEIAIEQHQKMLEAKKEAGIKRESSGELF